MGDVVVRQGERALQDQRLEDRGVEPAVRGRPVGEQRVGDPGVAQREPEGALEVRVDVAELEGRALRRVGRAQRRVLDLLDVEVLAQRGRERLLAGGLEAADEAVGREDGQPGVLQRDEAHQDVGVGALAAAALLRVHARGLVAVVSVGDEQLRALERAVHRRDGVRVADPPQAVAGAVGVGRLAVGRLGEDRLDGRPRGPRRVVVEREDGGEVRAGRAREPEAVLLGPGVRALVRADAAGPVVLDPHPGEDPVARAGAAVGSRVVLGERPQGRLVVLDHDALGAPGGERRGRVLVGLGPLGQVDLDDVVGGARRAARRAARRR